MAHSLTPEQLIQKAEETRIHNLKVAQEGSWLNRIFTEHNLSRKQRQEVLRRAMRDPKTEVTR
jgi:hypothetical protein